MSNLKDLLVAAGYNVEDEDISEGLVIQILSKARSAYTLFNGHLDPRAEHHVTVRGGNVHVHSELPLLKRNIQEIIDYLVDNPDGYYGFVATYSGYGDEPEDEFYEIIYRDVKDNEELRRQLYSRCQSVGWAASKIEILGDPGRHPKIDRVVWTYQYGDVHAWTGEIHYKSGKVIPIRI